MTPYSSLPSGVLNAGGSGGRCHTLQLNPGTVLYPNSNSKFAGSVRSGVSGLFRAREKNGRNGRGRDASVRGPSGTETTPSGGATSSVARGRFAARNTRHREEVPSRDARRRPKPLARNRVCPPRERAAERGSGRRGCARVDARARDVPHAVVRGEQLDGGSPVLGNVDEHRALVLVRVRRDLLHLDRQAQRRLGGTAATPARACVATTPSATAPEAIIATRDQRDAFAAPSSLTRRRGASPSRARRGTRSHLARAIWLKLSIPVGCWAMEVTVHTSLRRLFLSKS